MPRPAAIRLAVAALVLAAPGARPTLAQQGAPPPPSPAPAAASTAASGAATAASPPEAASEISGGRTLNGHRFMPTAVVQQPFVITSLASFMTVGLGTTTGTLTIGDKVYSGSFEYAGVGGVLGYEYAFLDFLSARFLLQEIIFSGINGDSALVVGTAVQVGGTLGITASMPLGDSVRLGFLLDVGFTPNLAITLGTGVANIINSCKAAGGSGCTVDTGQLFGSTNVLAVQPAVSASWAPLRALGLTGSVQYVYASQTASGTTYDGQAIVLAAAADYDFAAISSVPVGLQAQFAWTVPFAGQGLQHVTDLGGGLFYTGRKDLSAGLQLVSRRFAVTPDVDVSWSTVLVQLGLRYYW